MLLVRSRITVRENVFKDGISLQKVHSVPKTASQVVVNKMEPALHAGYRTSLGTWFLVNLMSAWSVKTRFFYPGV